MQTFLDIVLKRSLINAQFTSLGTREINELLLETEDLKKYVYNKYVTHH